MSNGALGGLTPKSLPPWAWVVAIAGGLIVGFLFLSSAGKGDVEEGEGGDAAGSTVSAKKGEGAVVVEPLSEDQLQGLGLTPGDYYAASYGDSGSSESSGDGVGGGIESPAPAATDFGPWTPYVPAATWEANVSTYPTSIPGQPVPVFSDPTQGVLPYGGVTSSTPTAPAPSAPSAGSCFVAGTPITVPGGTKPIELVAPDDEVLAFDFASGELVPTTVERVDRHERDDERQVIEVRTPAGVLIGTPEHVIWTGEQWSSLSEAETIALADGGNASVLERTALEGRASVYNLHVAHPDHVYVAAGFLVHNVKAA